ncbi:MAG: hypothetical protein AAB766_02115 [Patescibacteria group bacterium]
MFVLRRLILWLVPILWILGLELTKSNVSYFWPVIIVLLVYFLFTCFVVCKGRLDKTFLRFIILPIFFGASGFVFLLFSVSAIFFHLMVLAIALALYALLKQYFTFFYFPFKYQPYSLESLTFYIGLVLFYFLFSGVFASMTLLKFNSTLALLVALTIVGLVLYQFFWVHKIIWRASWPFVVVICLILFEATIVLSYLPVGYYVSAFIVTLMAYVMLGTSRAFLQNMLNRKLVTSYLLVASIMAVIVLFSARWS